MRYRSCQSPWAAVQSPAGRQSLATLVGYFHLPVAALGVSTVASMSQPTFRKIAALTIDDLKVRQMERALPTIAELLELPAITSGQPVIKAGEEWLRRRIRWVHVWVHMTEFTDTEKLLKGGELVLTTGIGLPTDHSALRTFVRRLRHAGVQGLMVELGRKYTAISAALVSAAQQHDLVLIALCKETPFVQITEAANTRIVDARVAQLQRSHYVHQRFSSLALEGATGQTVLEVCSELCEAPVVLENTAHRVMAFSSVGEEHADHLNDWERKSRALDKAPAAASSERDTWMTATVGARGEVWGRLVVLAPERGISDTDIVRQAASTLAMIRLSERDQISIWSQAHRDVLRRLQERSFPSITAINAESSALGVPLLNRILVGVNVIFQDMEPIQNSRKNLLVQDGLERIDRATSAMLLPALMQSVETDGILLLLSLEQGCNIRKSLETLASRIHADHSSSKALIGAGTPAFDLLDARRTLNEAMQVAQAIGNDVERKPYYELADIRLVGFLHLLRSDSRLHGFVERELQRLIDFDSDHNTEHLHTLKIYLSSGRHKSIAASKLGISRPGLYARLERISEIIDADLEDVETCVSLHVAILALHSINSSSWNADALQGRIEQI